MPGCVTATRLLPSARQPVLTWESATLGILDELLANGAIRLDVSERNPAGSPELRQVVLQTAGRESELTEPGQLFVKLGFKPWAPVPDAVIGELVAGGPAEDAGMQSGDRVLAVDGIAVNRLGGMGRAGAGAARSAYRRQPAEGRGGAGSGG